MTREEIRSVLASCLEAEAPGSQPPADQEWRSLESRYSCQFPPEMRHFISLMAEYAFPGDILNVGTGPNNGNDTILLTYDFETAENPSWLPEMVPFYAIGSGDYFCVSSLRCPDTPVFYYYAERNQFEEYSPSFEAWVLGLPQFFA